MWRTSQRLPTIFVSKPLTDEYDCVPTSFRRQAFEPRKGLLLAPVAVFVESRSWLTSGLRDTDGPDFDSGVALKLNLFGLPTGVGKANVSRHLVTRHPCGETACRAYTLHG